MSEQTPETPETPETKKDHRLYGGQTKAFTDLNGNFYPNSFWMRGLVCDPYLKILEFRNYGFQSPEFHDNGGSPFSEKDSGVKNPLWRGTSFDRIIKANPHLVGPCIVGMKEITALIRDYPNENGTDFISFFDDAEDVPPPPPQTKTGGAKKAK